MRKGLRAEKRSADAIAILKDVWVCRLLEMFLDQSPLIKFSRHLAPDFASAATFEVVGGKLRQTSDVRRCVGIIRATSYASCIIALPRMPRCDR